MSSPVSIGELIRERRLARGFSLGQLATQLRQTPAEVRRWERGEDLPSGDLVPELAEVLEIDVAGIEALRPIVEEPPETEDVAVASEPELVDDRLEDPADPFADSATEPAGLEAFSDAAATTVSAEADLDDADRVGELDGEDDEPGGDRTPEGEVGSFVAGLTARPAGIAPSEPPTEPIAAQVATLAPPPAAQAGPPSVPTAETTGVGRIPNPLELLFDPHRRWLYWIRYVLTVVVLFVVLRVFVWGVGELWEALGQLLDTFESTDDAEALRPLIGF